MENKRRHLTLPAAICGLFMLPAGVWACSCMPYPTHPQLAVEQAWKQADTILTARVLNKRLIPDRRHGEQIEVLLKVKQQWKGAPQYRLWIRTARNSAACGYTFGHKRDYLVFLSRDPASDQYTTGLCSLTRRLDRAREHVAALDKVAASENIVRRDLEK